jgi:hypothetical protein
MNRWHGRIAIVSLLMSGVLSFGALARLSEAATANGLAHFTFDDGSLRTVSFNATTQRDGTAVGNIDIQDRVPIPSQDVDGTGDPNLAGSPTGVNLTARVECLVVKGTEAILGGQITRADVPRYVGKYVLLFVEDRGRAQPRLNWGFYEPETGVSCESVPEGAVSLVEIAGGSVKVRP